MKRLVFFALLVFMIVPVVSAEATLLTPTSYSWNHTMNDHDYLGETSGHPVGLAFDDDTGTYSAWNWYSFTNVFYPAGTEINYCKIYSSGGQNNAWLYRGNATVIGGTYFVVPQNSWYNATNFINNEYENLLILKMGNGVLSEFDCYGTPAAVVTDFSGVPVNGSAPLIVDFTDETMPTTTSWNWSSSPSGGVSWSSTSTRNATAWFNLDGNYTITHGAADAYTSDIETKTDYIQVYNSSQLATTYVTAINALTANPIHGAQVDLKDVENSSWSNTTTTAGTGSILTLTGHHVDAYASAAGFDDNDKLGITAGGWESILLFSPGLKNVTAGNITLYVNVYDSGDHSKAIDGAAVTVVSPTVAMGGYTNAGGIVSFTVPNQTTLLVDVKALGQGYKGATQSVSTGTGSGGSASVTVTFYLEKNYVTPTATVTTLPGGGLPTTAATVDPYPCDADHPENCQRKQTDMANLVIQYGPTLVMLFIMATVLGVFKMMGGR